MSSCSEYEKRLNVLSFSSIKFSSGGNKRKVSAALAFMANPALVFLDEPTTVRFKERLWVRKEYLLVNFDLQGLDAAAKRKLWNVIRSARDIGLTIILTSHRYDTRDIVLILSVLGL